MTTSLLNVIHLPPPLANVLEPSTRTSEYEPELLHAYSFNVAEPDVPCVVFALCTYIWTDFTVELFKILLISESLELVNLKLPL